MGQELNQTTTHFPEKRLKEEYKRKEILAPFLIKQLFNNKEQS